MRLLHRCVRFRSSKPETKDILRSVSGTAQPGEVVALLGPTGAGKSTLLDIIARRLVPTEGSVYFNSFPLRSYHKSVIAYVLQDDLFFEHLTVRQTIEFSAMLRLLHSFLWGYKSSFAALCSDFHST
jgi:ABC-type multidrug transport system ATPase subunit